MLIERYAKLGWSLVAIPAGSKAPTTFGWQTKATPPDHWAKNPNHNVGLLHGPSGTCAIDIDHMPHFRLICEGMGLDLDSLLKSAPRIVGRPDRGKLLFRVPTGAQLTTRKISWPVEGDGRKTEVIFELRAGQVQDVLPPSVHPETGNPYTWAGPSFESLPTLPDQWLTIWQNWDSFRPQLMSLCPWLPASQRPTAPPPSTRRKAPKGTESVIEQYNSATPIAEALTRAGYKQIGRSKRWLSPNSTSGLPGVVIFDDGRAYSHHASDPFDPAHSFDAFDVFCHYEHLGNVSAAVKAAAEALELDKLPTAPSDADREATRHGAEIASLILPSMRKGADNGWEPQEIPDHLLTIPGVLSELVDYSAKTAIKAQPQFDVQAALAIGSVTMGRRFVTDNRNMTSLFFLNLAKTGAGKEHVNTVIEEALSAADLIHLRGPNGFTSGSGVMSTLIDQPACIAIMDEFGSMLETATAKGMQHRKEALTLMMEAWGRQTKSLRMLGYSTLQMTPGQKKIMTSTVENPSLTVVGMSTPETFFDAIKSRDAASGFLNRFLIVESHLPRMRSRNPDAMDVPPAVVDWMRANATAEGQGAGNLSDRGPNFPPIPVMLPFNGRARELLSDYEIRIIEKQNGLNNTALEDMLNRAREIAMRLSLIVARSLGDTEIGDHAVQWAIDYVEFYSARILARLDERMAEGETDSLRKLAAAAIYRSGAAGMKTAELIRAVPRLGNLKKHERDGILSMICEDYNIEKLAQQKNGKGRPAMIWRAVQGGLQ